MRGARFLLAILIALAAASCARQQPVYVIDPATGQPVPVVAQQTYAQPQYAQQTYQQPVAQPQYTQQPLYAQQTYQQPIAQPQYAQQAEYTQQTYHQPVAPLAPSGERGLFNTRPRAPPVYVQPQVQQPVRQSYVLQYNPPQSAAPPPAPPQYASPQYAAPQYAPPQYATPQYSVGGPYAAAPYGYASASPYQPPYTLDSGDRLRVVVFGQDGISNAYTVDAGGNVNLPLVGVVPARGATTQQLAQIISERLKQGYVREPHVTVEVESYRPFFILGEVTNPGQYPYVADMTVEKAIAIAGGFAPRASKGDVEITRSAPGQQFKGKVPLTYPMRPGDTVVVKERWF
jgi:polysaccharide biosynthesis/export protein